MERAKKLQEQREKEMVEKQKQQEMAAGNFFLYYGSIAFLCKILLFANSTLVLIIWEYNFAFVNLFTGFFSFTKNRQ